MVIGRKSRPSGIPNLGCDEEEHSIQCKAAQRWYSGVWKLEGQTTRFCSMLVYSAPCWFAPGALVCSALCQSVLACAGLLRSAPVRQPQCFSSARGCSLQSWKEITLLEPGGSWLPWKEVLTPGPWLDWELQILAVDWSKRDCPDWPK